MLRTPIGSSFQPHQCNLLTSWKFFLKQKYFNKQVFEIYHLEYTEVIKKKPHKALDAQQQSNYIYQATHTLPFSNPSLRKNML